MNKNNTRLIAYGDVDELNSQLGVLIDLLRSTSSSQSIHSDDSELKKLIAPLTQIQNEIFIIGSTLACESPIVLKQLPQLTETLIHQLEQQIDQWDLILPNLKNFILPQGHVTASQAHVCRTVCRRAERQIFTLLENLREEQTHEELLPPIALALKYTNRLSDYLFVLSRIILFHLKVSEVLWKNS